ncbi:MAG: hypothetical protein KGL39_56350, partial [Patescibacteria group bacterium]|nr:hypothetical protein [Patescibacteria group bacterium]
MITGFSTKELRIRHLEELRRTINYRLGLLEGRTNTVDNSKSLIIGWNDQDACANATINVSSFYCIGTSFAIAGVLFELLDSTGTTVLQTTTGSSASFTVSGGNSYYVRMSNAAYWTQTVSVTVSCGETKTFSTYT